MKKISKNLEETHQIAEEFVESLNALVKTGQLSSGASVVGLHGDLGSGKTSFVQGVARTLGVSDGVISPTFVLQKRYPIKRHPHFKNLIHIDAYRLDKPEDIIPLDWHNLLKNKENVIFIEWPEKLGEYMPKDYKKIVFEFLNPETREIEF